MPISTPLGPWGMGASAGPATEGLKGLSGRVQNPDHIRCDQGGKRVRQPQQRTSPALYAHILPIFCAPTSSATRHRPASQPGPHNRAAQPRKTQAHGPQRSQEHPPSSHVTPAHPHITCTSHHHDRAHKYIHVATASSSSRTLDCESPSFTPKWALACRRPLAARSCRNPGLMRRLSAPLPAPPAARCRSAQR